jgi:hypothetical protein
VSDGNLEGLLRQSPDQEIAEIFLRISKAVSFERLTESARLRLEPETGTEERERDAGS